jgi:hypothetical protein
MAQCFGQGLEIELTARPAFSSLRGNEAVKDNYDPTYNFSAGLGANYFYDNKSFLSFAILYDQKGAKGESTIVLRDDQNQIIGEGTVSHESYFQYITIPIQWGQRFGERFKYEFGVGFYTSLLLKNELIGKGQGLKSTEDQTNHYKNVDIGLSISFNTYLPIKDNLALKVGLNDNLGIINTSAIPVMGNGTIKHNSIGFQVGLNFRLN